MMPNPTRCSKERGKTQLRPNSLVSDALAATLGAALVATARPGDVGLRNELLASALNVLRDADKELPTPESSAVKQLIDVVGDRDSSAERIRRGSIATYQVVSLKREKLR